MPVRVFQVDAAARFEPFTFEREAIQAGGGDFVVGKCTTEAEVIAQAGNAEIFLLARAPIVTPAAMDALPNLRLIIRWGVGYDTIDVGAATARGIAVANAPTYCTVDVAEHAMSLLHVIARRVVWAHERMREGAYQPPSGPIHRLTGSTLGIIGCGRIGSAVAQRAQGIGMKVIAYDKYRSADDLRAIGVTPVSFEEALDQADYLTFHTLLTAETRGMIDAAAISRMKPDVMIVNTSRGGIIDQDALVAALQSGRVAGAALDVFETEPLPVDHPLRSMEHVVLTPHTAAFSLESIEDLRREMCNTVTTWIRDGWSDVVVNPEVRPTLRPRLIG